jgi:hypothetical protein
LFANAEELFAEHPVVESLDIVAEKVPLKGITTGEGPIFVIDKWRA